MSAAMEPIHWETDLPLFSRVMLVQWTGAMFATWVLVLVIMVPIFISQDEADAILTLAPWMAAGVGFVWVLGLLVMALVFRGRVRVRYTLDGKGIQFESIDTVARAGSRVAAAAGVLAGKPGLAGAGMLAMTRESEAVRWAGAFRAVFRPSSRAILLRNTWRTLMWVQCGDADTYDRVAAAVREQMAARGTEDRVGSGPGLLSYVGHTALVTLACLPLFYIVEEFDTGLFAPLFVYCFALATVWMVPLLAYAVIGGIAVVVLMVAADLLEVRESTLFPGSSYQGYEVVSSDDLGLLLAAAAGTALLLWLSWRYLTGRSQSALIAGRGQMGDG